MVYGKVKPLRGIAEAKASVNCANESYAADQKPGELPMARLKLL